MLGFAKFLYIYIKKIIVKVIKFTIFYIKSCNFFMMKKLKVHVNFTCNKSMKNYNLLFKIIIKNFEIF